jgi:ribosome assembly protein 4
LEETLQHLAESGNDVSYETALTISYQPLSVYRVRPVTRCVETMPGHTDAVLVVAYSPDGRKLGSGGGDASVRFWNTTTSLPVHTCTGHRNHVLAAAWSPDGAVFVTADLNGEIRVWDPETGRGKGQPLKGHKKWVTSLSFEPMHSDPTCCRMASASKDNSTRVWNVTSGRCETIISGHSDSVEVVKWGGNGLIYTASRDRTIMVWAIDGHGRSQQKLVRTLTGHAHRINTLALSCDYVLRTGMPRNICAEYFSPCSFLFL